MENTAQDFWKMRRAFVSGGTGLLGCWLIDELLLRGAKVTCLVRDWTPASRLFTEGTFQKVNIVRGELEDYLTLARILNEYEIDSVFHLAAQTNVDNSTRSALSTFESNIRGTWNILEACKMLGEQVHRIVIASSAQAYGTSSELPYTEEMPLQGCYPYDVSKSCADLIARAYIYTYQTPIAILRCSNLYGGGDLNFNRIIPGTIRSILAGEAPVIRGDGKPVREFLYVKDAIRALIGVAERLPEEKIFGQSFNVSSEQPLSVLAVVQLILDLMHEDRLQPVVLNQVVPEIQVQQLDCKKAHSMFNWRATYTLKAGLQETIDWYRFNLK